MASKVAQLAAEVASRMNGSPFENHERILALVEAVKAEERERIRETYIGEVGGNYVIPASVLDSKEAV